MNMTIKNIVQLQYLCHYVLFFSLHVFFFGIKLSILYYSDALYQVVNINISKY